MAELRRSVVALRAVVARSPQLHKWLLHKWQCTGDLSDRGAIGGRADAEGHRLTSKLAVFLDDELVRQGVASERFSNASERRLVGHRERDDDRRRIARSFGGSMCYLGDLRTVREVGPY